MTGGSVSHEAARFVTRAKDESLAEWKGTNITTGPFARSPSGGQAFATSRPMRAPVFS